MNDKIKKQLGRLYVVSTPIGNLADMTVRAVEVLNSVSHILAEDTRHSRALLAHYGIGTPCRSCHQHNEHAQIEWIKSMLSLGQDVALISDAGTPLICDPGYPIVRSLREAGFTIYTVPGACALISALSISGLSTTQFVFDGFLPHKSAARQKQLQQYKSETRTAVVYESSHRIKACLHDCLIVLGGQRQCVVAREMTKKFETVLFGSIQEVLHQIECHAEQSKGEFVLLIEGVSTHDVAETEMLATYDILHQELAQTVSSKSLAGIVAKLLGSKKNAVYQAVLARAKND